MTDIRWGILLLICVLPDLTMVSTFGWTRPTLCTYLVFQQKKSLKIWNASKYPIIIAIRKRKQRFSLAWIEKWKNYYFYSFWIHIISFQSGRMNQNPQMFMKRVGPFSNPHQQRQKIYNHPYMENTRIYEVSVPGVPT